MRMLMLPESGYIWAVELPYFDYEYGYDGDIWTTERMFRTRKQAEVFANAWNKRVELNKLLDVRNSRETSTARVKSYRVGGVILTLNPSNQTMMK